MPSRWCELNTKHHDSYLPFGRGPEMCPASSHALRALEDITSDICSQFKVTARCNRLARPRVLTLIAPPQGVTILQTYQNGPRTKS